MTARRRRQLLIVTNLAALASFAHAQSAAGPGPAPVTRAAVGAWDVWIVQRAADLLATPDKWNRHEGEECADTAKSFSIRCAIDRAVEEGAGIRRDALGAVIGAARTPARPVDCRFHAVPDGREGTCGTLFDEVPVFTLSRIKAVTSGVWRKDAQPTEVWAGIMSDAEGPVEYEARQLVNVVANGKKYPGRLVGYNNDSTTSFADVQNFMKLLKDRVVEHGAADLAQSFDSVEVEAYAGGTGVIRTYTGWYAISGFTSRDSMLHFAIDTSSEIAPNALDLEILKRASTVITSDAVWNRADNRKCPTTATTWSIYCAVERAEIEVTGGFHHRRPAMELVRVIVEDRAKAKPYQHRLMGYNNDSTTTLADVRSLFAEAIARIK